ncbi:MAG TPA: hypothetical protein VK203_17465 [Nostocaceae cyanobacterium]|nr:hypothetical protein [Nostocaceae cyanobacterium]
MNLLSFGILNALPSPALSAMGCHVWTPHFDVDSLTAIAVSPRQSDWQIVVLSAISDRHLAFRKENERH